MNAPIAPPKPRPYQLQLKHDIYSAWHAGKKAVMAVAATGSGKTVTFSSIMFEYSQPSCAIVHRQELVAQISMSLSDYGVRHRVIAPPEVVKRIVRSQMEKHGRNYVDPRSTRAVAGVDTLVRMDDSAEIFRDTRLWIGDEWHHCLRENKWGKVVAKFRNSIGAGFTATPARADGRGLGAGDDNDGVCDALVEAPGMRDIIDMGYLTDYRIFAPPNDVSLVGVNITASGEFSHEKLVAAVNASRTLTGDVVTQYLRLTPGKLGIVFAVDVDNAKKIAAAFNASNVRAEIVSAKTPDALRDRILRQFKSREVLVLVNVDLFGEGFDVPACEVVQFARHTNSFPLYVQQFGRGTRLMIDRSIAAVWDSFTDEQRRGYIATSAKPITTIIDHVGNVVRHGLPDAPRVNTLARRGGGKSGASDAIPLRVCANPACNRVYERVKTKCPYCEQVPVPVARSGPEYVDGDLHELDLEYLRAMRKEIDKVDRGAAIPPSLSDMAARRLQNIHLDWQDAQRRLRLAMQWYGGKLQAEGFELSEAWRRFYFEFGVDVATAQTLRKAEADVLNERIVERLLIDGVVISN